MRRVAGGALGGRDSRFESGMAWTFDYLWGYFYYRVRRGGLGYRNADVFAIPT
jgi:hypothetical protein